jgi:tRNA/tmRNA/rRNA uracil-C5-methylase (TrmA/RlmC/RlmD family)
MHVAYSAQLDAKGELVKRAFRVARLPVTEFSLVGTETTLGYRRRARLHWVRGSDGQVCLGFKRRSSSQVLEVITAVQCPVLAAPLRRAAEALRPLLARPVLPAQGALNLLCGNNGEVSAALQPDTAPARKRRPRGRLVRKRRRSPHRRQNAEQAAPGTKDVNAGKYDALDKPLRTVLQDGALAGVEVCDHRGAILHQWGRTTLPLHGADSTETPPLVLGTPVGFAQANPEADDWLRAALIRRVVDSGAHETAFDVAANTGSIMELYAGAGNFTALLAAHGPVRAIERDERACALLRQAKRLWPQGNRVAVQTASVETVLRAPVRSSRQAEYSATPTVVVLDPPRCGARAAMPLIAALKPQRVVYVSCDPMTCARDLKILTAQGYVLSRVEGVDSMPHTPHCELLVTAEQVAH